MNRVVKKIDNMERVLRGLSAVTEMSVLVGIPRAKAPRHSEEAIATAQKLLKASGVKRPTRKAALASLGGAAQGDVLNNAMLGFIHDRGSPAQGIPPRPFLAVGIKDKQKEISKRLAHAAQTGLNTGSEIAVHKELIAVGLVAQSAVQNRIRTGPFEELSPRTLAARRRRGRTGTKPLIDTSQLLNAINFVIEKA